MFISNFKNKNNNINYVYHDLIENNKVVEEFININELKNIEVFYNLNEIKKNKFDFFIIEIFRHLEVCMNSKQYG